MLARWVVEESCDVNLQDKRLNSRMTEVLAQLGGSPNKSIPSACLTWSETLAAYRFFDNPKVTFERILEPHIAATYRRIRKQSVVILSQDTTEIELTRPQRKVVGAGPLDSGSRWGAFLHPMLACTPEGTPLGNVYAEAWARDTPPDIARTKKQQEHDRKQTSFENKESYRWYQSLVQAEDVAQQSPETHVVCVADSEADIYELLASEKKDRVDWIVRGCQNRLLSNDSDKPKDEETVGFLREKVLQAPPRFTNEIHVGKRNSKLPNDTRNRKQSRPARDAVIEVRAAKVKLRAPWRCDKKLLDVNVHAVLVSEVDPPQDEEPIEWMLLTSLPIGTDEEVRTVIQYYTVRWMIEIYFRILKSSCRIEERQFETLERFLNAVAIYMIVAWRSLFICRIAREMPNERCELIFEPEEWKSLQSFITMKPPQDKPPTLQEIVRAIGQLGGYTNRKRNDEPGPLTVTLGLQRSHDITRCWLAFGPGESS